LAMEEGNGVRPGYGQRPANIAYTIYRELDTVIGSEDGVTS